MTDSLVVAERMFLTTSKDSFDKFSDFLWIIIMI